MLNEETTYTQLRENLASKLAQVADNNTIVVIKRRDGKDVALIASDELSSLLETVYLLRSPEDCSSLV
jgi:antitoxin YefM